MEDVRIEEVEEIEEELEESQENLEEQISELSDEVEALQEYKRDSQEEKKKLLESVDILMSDKLAHESANAELKHQINELLASLAQSEKKIEQVQRDSSISDIEIEPKIYLKGMFNWFDKTTNVLSIFVDAKEYFYSLDEYQCSHLPISGSRILIFKSEDDKNLIYGFDVSKIIDGALKVKAEVKHISKMQGRLKLHIPEYGYVNFKPNEDFFKKYEVTTGDKLLLNQIFIDGDYHFCVAQSISGSFDRNKILLTLQREDF